MADIALLGTFQTKAAELAVLEQLLQASGLQVTKVDMSLGATGQCLPGEAKVKRMKAQAVLAARALLDAQASAVLALGGGTGSDMALNALRGLPIETPKFLITTLPFDPRDALADNNTVLIPSLCDIQGLNDVLLMTFERAVALVKASVTTTPMRRTAPAIGLSLLGVTQAACDHILPRLAAHGLETMSFHANGFGGAAFTRCVEEDRLAGTIDLTLNELVRMHVGGPLVAMPTRYTAQAHLPRVVLPGATTFFDAGPISNLTDALRARPHYSHSSHFTHVKLLPDEIAQVAKALADALNQSHAPCSVLLPMGGFSSEDRPGGAIEDPDLRHLLADILETNARAYSIERLPHHIGDPETADLAVSRLLENMN